MRLPVPTIPEADEPGQPVFGVPAQSAPQRAARVEAGDAPSTTATPYAVAPGDSFAGQLNGDTDWVRVHLQAGTTYVIDLTGAGASPISDTYLTLRNGSGGYITADDDSGPGRDARLTFTATTTGVHYIEINSYYYEAGSYRLDIAVERPDTVQDIAGYLTDGYWRDSGGARRAFDIPQNGVLTVDISGLTGAGQRLALDALAAWTAATGLQFRGRVGGANITFDDSDSGAYSTSTVSGGRILDSFVNVSTDWLATYGTDWTSYSFQTYIHEIGHALGLGHAGPYNGSADWGWDNAFDNDSWQASVMSYFDQDDNPGVAASRAALLTPMVADVMAIRALYGDRGLLRAGDSSYGTTTNAGGIYAVAANLLQRATPDGVGFTIVDEGGTDTLDLSASHGRVVIDLRQGMHSSAGGEVDNISIALGTIIENAVGGAGGDLIRGNAVANRLTGQGGNDRIEGYAGNDTLLGGDGTDTLLGGAGDDQYHWTAGDIIVEAADPAGGIDTVLASAAHTLAAGVDNLTLGGTAAISGIGNALANRLAGNVAANRLAGGAGNDTINGGAGNDTMEGGVGDDLYAWAPGDVIVEAAGGGFDIVMSAHSHQLGANVEGVILTGTAAVNATGSALANRLTGNAAANRLIGGAGDDTLSGLGGSDRLEGGPGNDTYVWSQGAVFIEAAGAGIDTLQTSATASLSAHFERLVLTGTGAINGVGNTLANTLVGNAAANRLNGGLGNDTLTGGGGADTFLFAAGADLVRDFVDNLDTLGISRALLGAQATVAMVMSRAAITAEGALFSFEGGHRLTVAGVSSLGQLTDDVVLF